MNAPLLLALVAVYVLAVLTAWAAADVVCRRRCSRIVTAVPYWPGRAGSAIRHRQPGATPPA